MKAVITGDIIHSTKLTTDDKRMLINEIEAGLKQWSKDFEMKYEIFRGDSFQCLLDNVMSALRLTLIIKSYIKSLNPSEKGETIRESGKKISMLFPVWEFDARIAIGIGEVQFLDTSLGKSDGSAFVLSGHTLDDLKNKKQSIGIATIDNYQEELQTEIVLLDLIISRMTALQSEVVSLKLLGYNETEIANQLGVNQSAVNQRSNGAGWNAINNMVQRFENIYSNEK